MPQKTFGCIASPPFLALSPAVLSSTQTQIIPFCRSSTCSLKLLFMSLHRTKKEMDSKQAVLEVARIILAWNLCACPLCCGSFFFPTSLWLSTLQKKLSQLSIGLPVCRGWLMPWKIESFFFVPSLSLVHHFTLSTGVCSSTLPWLTKSVPTDTWLSNFSLLDIAVVGLN